jgi:hypothetical protein
VAAKASPDALQDAIADGVPQQVVDLLEAIEVEQDQDHGRGSALHARQLLGHRSVEAAAVDQAGQRVGVGGQRHALHACRELADEPLHPLAHRSDHEADGPHGPDRDQPALRTAVGALCQQQRPVGGGHDHDLGGARPPRQDREGHERRPDVEQRVDAVGAAAGVDARGHQQRGAGQRHEQDAPRARPARHAQREPDDQRGREDGVDRPVLLPRGLRQHHRSQAEPRADEVQRRQEARRAAVGERAHPEPIGTPGASLSPRVRKAGAPRSADP